MLLLCTLPIVIEWSNTNTQTARQVLLTFRWPSMSLPEARRGPRLFNDLGAD